MGEEPKPMNEREVFMSQKMTLNTGHSGELFKWINGLWSEMSVEEQAAVGFLKNQETGEEVEVGFSAEQVVDLLEGAGDSNSVQEVGEQLVYLMQQELANGVSTILAPQGDLKHWARRYTDAGEEMSIRVEEMVTNKLDRAVATDLNDRIFNTFSVSMLITEATKGRLWQIKGGGVFSERLLNLRGVARSVVDSYEMLQRLLQNEEGQLEPFGHLVTGEMFGEVSRREMAIKDQAKKISGLFADNE